MKHIKLFESETHFSSYWLLPTDDRFEDSLRKIGCPDDVYNQKFKNNNNIKKFKYIFIGYSCYTYVFDYIKNINNPDKWGWNHYNSTLSDPYYEENKYKFMGLVNISDFELEANKFNI